MGRAPKLQWSHNAESLGTMGAPGQHSGDLPMPIEALWVGALSHLDAADYVQLAAASRSAQAAVAVASRTALGSFHRASSWELPSGLGWAEAFRRAQEWPRILILGGEDSMDEPQLHLSMVSLSVHAHAGPQARRPYHFRLPAEAELPGGRYRLSATRVGGFVYVTGGTGPEGDDCPDVLKLDVIGHCWQQSCKAMPMPTPRCGHETVALFDRYLLCIGGKVSGRLQPGCDERARRLQLDEKVGGSADCLDTFTGRWVTLPCRLSSPRVYFGAAVLGNTVIVTGGSATSVNHTAPEGRLSSTELLDVTHLPALFEGRDDAAQLMWRPGPSLLFPRYDFSLACCKTGQGSLLFAVGGSGARRLVEVLDSAAIALWMANRGKSSKDSTVADEVQRDLLQEGWVDVHTRAPHRAPQSRPNAWALHPVELPDTRSCGNVVGIGHTLFLVGGSQRQVLAYTLGQPSWVSLGVELDSMRLGAKAVALGFREVSEGLSCP